MSATPESAVLPDARPASLVLRLTPDFALPFVQLARLDRPAGWQLLLAPCWQGAALAGLALHRGPNLWHLVLFLVGAVSTGGLGIDDKAATAIYGLYTASVYLAALPGGWIADRLIGARRAVLFGGLIITLGNALLALSSTPTGFYLGLVVVH